MVFTSLMCQTCKEFEWFIIDDGSTDNTKEVVDGFIKKADFSIRYYWKPNGGRHTAVNYSYQYLKTKYVVTCDSDDELLPDAVEKIINLWKKIERLEEYDRIWCITGRDIDSETREIVGIPFPLDMNELPRKKKRITELRCTGEKHCSRKVAVHKMYKFPEPKDTKFITKILSGRKSIMNTNNILQTSHLGFITRITLIA